MLAVSPPGTCIRINRYNRQLFFWASVNKHTASLTLEAARKSGSTLTALVNAIKLKTLTVVDTTGNRDLALAFAEGMILGNYQFLKYRENPEKDRNSLTQILIVCPRLRPGDLLNLKAVTSATMKARTLVNEPVNFLNASQLAAEFKSMGKEAGFRVEVFSKARIESLKMGGLLAVNRGSIDPPTFTVMEYKPRRARNKKPVVLVGKGVVFDTGGVSLKPTPNSMDMMKCDMAGAATVGCAMYAIAKAKLPVHVIALVPATDNRPGMNAYVPGDVITMMSGLTVEMLNADAEGRMILADALHYAKRFSPELLLEFSTLTGAAKAAIGSMGVVCMGTASEAVKNKLKACGDQVYERLAEMPFWDEYDDMLKSDIAAMKNIGGPEGGAITAGKFLTRFTDYPYMHFDIAGPAFLTSPDTWRGKGGTGVGVRLLFEYLKRR
ncbi:MAG: leucyl aminopeptidase [Bacteroidia bacterium]|nr:leucyl aminopeptidase [Bacteroidia bacterium]